MNADIWKIVAFTVLFLFVGGCSDDDSPVAPSPTSTTPFMPLAVGNYWVSQYTMRDAEGNVTYMDTDSLAITRIDTVDSEPWYFASNYYFYIGREDGLWWGKEKSKSPTQLYKYPVVKGHTYEITSEYGTLTKYAVLDTAVTVTVPAGTFTCWKYYLECTGCGSEDTVYIAPGVGEVLINVRMATGATQEVALLRYRVLSE